MVELSEDYIIILLRVHRVYYTYRNITMQTIKYRDYVDLYLTHMLQH